MRPPELGPVGRALRRFAAAHTGPVPFPLVGGVLGVGAAVALLVVGHRPGLGLALAVPLIWAPAVPTLVRAREWSRLLTAALALALGAMAAVRAAEWVVALCLLAAFVLSAVAATGARSPLGIVLATPTLPAAAARATRWLTSGVSHAATGRRSEVLRWLRTAVVTLILVVVFTALLASADAVFATLVPSLDLMRLPGQVVAGVLAASGALAIASLAVRRPTWARVRLPRPAASGRAEWFVPVLALDALMLAFLLTQVVAASGGESYVRRTAGLSYAEYARAGFGQLVVVTALTLALVAWFARRAPREERHDRMAATTALGMLCGGAVGVVVTALGRMALYVQAYGLTELRLLATAGEIVMGATLVMVLAAGVRWRARWLPLAVLRVAGLLVLALALVNPDAQMVRYNTQILEVPVDVRHLEQLSLDAVPTIAGLEDPLRSCLLQSYGVPEPSSIWEWNLARERAAAALDDVPIAPRCTRSF